MSRDSSRKLSGSSSQSSAHSPTSTSNQPHSSRRITPTTTGNMLSVGVGGGSGLMGYNSGWQVWGSGSPSSQRNPSISSAASAGDIPSSQNDSGYRGTIREGWTSSRPASGTWDEDVAQSPLKEFSQSHEAQAPLSLPSRQRQASATPFSGPRAENRPAKLSPQAYDHNLNPESTSPRYNTSPSSATFVSSPYSPSHSATQPPTLTGASGYDPLITNTSDADDLSLTFRGMAVEDDYSGWSKSIPPASMPSNMMQRPLPASVPRPPYSNYPGFSEYSYSFDTSRAPVDPSIYGSPALTNAPYPGMAPQGLLPTPSNDLRQPNVFYDFASRPHASQFYYPAQQGIMFPPLTSSPMIPSQLPPALLDKKRELSQQLVAQALMFPRSNSSPHLPIYPTNIEYSQLPLMMPNAPLYGSNLAAQMFHQGMQQNTRGILQSPLLLEFHANKTRNWELRDIMNHVVEFSGDQHGSRLIQHKLESASSEEKQKVFEEIVPNNVLQLIQDIFGNYVIQKLFEHGTQVQKSRLAAAMEGHILPLSKQMYGCRVVQKAIEYILPEQQVMIVHELEPHIMECIHDANGNHVIQKIIERVSPDRLGFVYGFRGNVQSLATHTFGCRVLQRALEYLPEVITAPLIEELHASTLLLMQNQFGNYVIQFVIEHAEPQDSAIVVSKLRGRLLVMARHKFASNVCEKALTFAHPETRRQLIDEILSPRPEGAVVLSMMKDQYANYVLQSAVRIADADQRESLINQIRPQLAVLLRISNGYSKHLVSIERCLQDFSPPHSAATIA